MTKLNLTESIAKTQGWTRTRERESNGIPYPNGWENKSTGETKFPDWLNDYNAIHKVIEGLDNSQEKEFVYYLSKIIYDEDDREEKELVTELDRLKATPFQLAVAFIQTTT